MSALPFSSRSLPRHSSNSSVSEDSSPTSRATAPPWAVVTGAGSGIGLALTNALLARGSEVIAIDRDISIIDSRAHACAIDVRDASAMAQLAQSLVGCPVSHVFANAGVGGMPGDVLSCSDEAWQWAFDVNVLGALRSLRLWWPHLQAGAGKAVATLSSAALQSFPGAGPYRATKAALLSAMEGLYYESRGSGVSVHALCPGMVRTDVMNTQRYDEYLRCTTAMAHNAKVQPNAFTAHVGQAMARAEPPDVFAARLLAQLDEGAPFYWVTHPESWAWIEGRHEAIRDGAKPFSRFGVPA